MCVINLFRGGKVSLKKSAERKDNQRFFFFSSFSCVHNFDTRLKITDDCVSNVRVYWLDQVPDILSNEHRTIKEKAEAKNKNKKTSTKSRRRIATTPSPRLKNVGFPNIQLFSTRMIINQTGRKKKRERVAHNDAQKKLPRKIRFDDTRNI